MLSENERKFDEILKKNLKKHRESIRDGFAGELLTKIRTAEQQNAIRKVVFQERISLAAFIILPLAVIAIICTFPGMVAGVGRFLEELPPLIGQTLITLVKQQCQLLAYCTVAVLTCLYMTYDVLRPESQ